MKKLSKLQLKGNADLLDDQEMKMIFGGYNDNGTIVGYSCRNGQCYVDISYDNSPDDIWCDQPMPMEVCRRFAGFTC